MWSKSRNSGHKIEKVVFFLSQEWIKSHELTFNTVIVKRKRNEHDTRVMNVMKHAFVRNILGDNCPVYVFGITWKSTREFLNLNTLPHVHRASWKSNIDREVGCETKTK